MAELPSPRPSALVVGIGASAGGLRRSRGSWPIRRPTPGWPSCWCSTSIPITRACWSNCSGALPRCRSGGRGRRRHTQRTAFSSFRPMPRSPSKMASSGGRLRRLRASFAAPSTPFSPRLLRTAASKRRRHRLVRCRQRRRSRRADDQGARRTDPGAGRVRASRSGRHAAERSRHRHGRSSHAGRGHAGHAGRLSQPLGQVAEQQGRRWNSHGLRRTPGGDHGAPARRHRPRFQRIQGERP